VSRRRPESSPQTRAVLRALYEVPGWSYGYDLARVTGLKSGTLYPMLARLAEHGLLDTAWEEAPPVGRPPRHLYRLSTAGAELAEALPADRAARPGSAQAAPRRTRHGRGGWVAAGTGQA
jgi:PadR family transcriptional regulator